MDQKVDIPRNLENVRARIAEAAHRSGRGEDQVILVGVSKTHPVDSVLMALGAGLRDFGENRVEEMEAKRPLVEERLLGEVTRPVWHMIGHVQSRKARQVVDVANMVHSVESLKLLGRLERFLAEADRFLPVLLEVNLSGEESKYGLPAQNWQEDKTQWENLCRFVEQVAGMQHLCLQGLMTMAPWVPDPAVIRPVFRSARRLLERLVMNYPEIGWKHLSMGMTDDFEIAIEEGATMVRVGRAIFGPRGES